MGRRDEILGAGDSGLRQRRQKHLEWPRLRQPGPFFVSQVSNQGAHDARVPGGIIQLYQYPALRQSEYDVRKRGFRRNNHSRRRFPAASIWSKGDFLGAGPALVKGENMSRLHLLCVLISLTPSLYAQNGEINGAVTDATGGVVAGASVTVTNNATNAARAVQTNATGNYTVPFLMPGVYATTDTGGLTQVGSARGIVQPGVSSNGGRGNTVNYALDGAYHNDHFTNVSLPVPDPDALQFRAEAFNLPNHANFNQPASSRSSATFGQITGSAAARVMQFAMKLRW